MTRCPWPTNPIALDYHDKEWGTPTHDDRTLFELLILEGAQAGLSWDTILAKVARFDAKKRAALLRDPGIVRNRLKVAASITNARAFLDVQDEFGSFDFY